MNELSEIIFPEIPDSVRPFPVDVIHMRLVRDKLKIHAIISG